MFIRHGRPSTFDGPTHLVNSAQFAAALRSFDFPVRWMDGFANYGMPMPIIIQQTTAYLGAFFILFTQNVVLSYNLVVFIATFFSLYFLYLFLTLYFSQNASLLASVLFAFAPYRIINIYIRGALPEYVSHVFFPVVMVGLYYFIHKRQARGLVYILIGIVGILLTHPFTLIIGGFLFIPYALWLFSQKKTYSHILSIIIPLMGVSCIALGIAAFYILPLIAEIKYFYYGQSGAGLKPDQFLSISNYMGDYWSYFTQSDIDVRGHIIHLGSVELAIIVMGIVVAYMKRARSHFIIWVLVSFPVLVFMTTSYANPTYSTISLLGSIQYNWRMFASIVFIAPIVSAFVYDAYQSKLFVIGVVVLTLFIRVPQLYGKNYLIEPSQKYYFTKENLHGVVLNTIWTGKSEDYPVQKHKGVIIEGDGIILNREESNSWRRYTTESVQTIRMADNTFYFPGWKVYIDGKEVPIEFQDMNYRGVITYNVPPGKHSIDVRFTNTKIRLLANTISIVSLMGVCLYLIIRLRRDPRILSTTRLGPQ